MENYVSGRYFMPEHNFNSVDELSQFLSGLDRTKKCTVYSYANPNFDVSFREHQFKKASICDTIIIDLTKSEQELWRELDKKRRNGISYAKKHGVIIKPVETDAELQAFCRIWRNMFEKRGWINHQTITWQKTAIEQNFIAIFEGNIIAGSRVMFNSMPYYSTNASLDEYRRYKPNELLLWETIRSLKKQGYQRFNLAGANTFKAEFSKSGRFTIDEWVKGQSKLFLVLARKTKRVMRVIAKLVRL